MLLQVVLEAFALKVFLSQEQSLLLTSRVQQLLRLRFLLPIVPFKLTKRFLMVLRLVYALKKCFSSKMSFVMLLL